MSAAEVLNVFRKVFHPVSVISCRRPVGTRVYGLSHFLVKFDTKEERDQALHHDFSEDKMTVTDTDGLLLDAVLVTGIPDAEKPAFFVDMFRPFGAAYLEAIEHTNANGDLALVASFSESSACDSFIRLIDGASINGSKLRATRLIYENGVRYNPTCPDMQAVLSSDLDFSLVYYGRVYKCWSGAAIALSGKIGQLAETDPDISEFVCPSIPGPFETVCEFFNGVDVEITGDNCGFIMAMAKAMEITDLYEKASEFVRVCRDNDLILPILEQLYTYKLPYLEQLHYAASVFDQGVFNERDVQKYPVELLEQMLTSPSAPTDEVFVFRFVKSLKHLLPDKCRRLMTCVRIADIPPATIAELLEDTFFDLNTLRIGLLERVNNCFLTTNELPVPVKTEVPRNMIIMFGLKCSFGDLFRADVFRMRDGQLFDGILAHLCRVCGENAAKAGLIRFVPSSSSSSSSTNHDGPAMLIDPNNTNYFATEDRSNSYIIVDFMRYRVSLTGYSLRTHSREGNGHITGWKIECQITESEWLLVDQQSGIRCLSSPGAEAHFDITVPSPYVRYIKLTQTERNTMGYSNLRLSRIEFFGSLQTTFQPTV